VMSMLNAHAAQLVSFDFQISSSNSRNDVLSSKSGYAQVRIYAEQLDT